MCGDDDNTMSFGWPCLSSQREASLAVDVAQRRSRRDWEVIEGGNVGASVEGVVLQSALHTLEHRVNEWLSQRGWLWERPQVGVDRS